MDNEETQTPATPEEQARARKHIVIINVVMIVFILLPFLVLLLMRYL